MQHHDHFNYSRGFTVRYLDEPTMIPLTNWDRFKRNHFPKWLLHYFPVQYMTRRDVMHMFQRRAERIEKELMQKLRTPEYDRK